MNQQQKDQMIEATGEIAFGVGYLAKDLSTPEAWEAMTIGERVGRGRWYGGAVRRGEIPDVELAGVDIHNHRVYVKIR